MGVLDFLGSIYETVNNHITIYHKVIIVVLCLGYILLIFYLEEKDKEEDDEQYLEIFKNDQEFFERLYKMDPKVRNHYLKTIKKVMDNKNIKTNKKAKTINKIKNTAIFAGITEFLLGGGGIFTLFSGTAKNAFTIGLTNAFT